MDIPTLLRILPIAMQFIQSATDPTTPAGQLAQEIRQLLFQHRTQLAQMAVMHPLMKGAYGTAPAELPSLEHLRTPEDVDASAKAAAAAAADQASLDARAATDQVNATLKAKLKKPFFVANPDGSIVIVTPDTSDLGFHFFSPDSADTPLDDAAPPAPAPAP
jgi:hypothetical protein